tara:strand:+ start:320 stop:520 length:201 start_codon:yes stop_codon:yes gene_type:complete
MSIKISERVILNNDDIEQIRVSYGKHCLSICSGYDSDNSGHVHFSGKQLSELIDVLQIFLEERGAA